MNYIFVLRPLLELDLIPPADLSLVRTPHGPDSPAQPISDRLSVCAMIVKTVEGLDG